MLLKVPSDIKWIEGELPDVHTVPYKCTVLVWTVYKDAHKSVPVGDGYGRKFVPASELGGEIKAIEMAQPWKDNLNPLRWCAGGMPMGYQEKVKYYAWLNDGKSKKE